MKENAMKVPLGLKGAVFIAGAAGLIYQVLWVRMLSIALGSTTGAVCLVLSVFMIGLALGGFIWGRRADRSGNPLKLYAALESLLGIYCAATPWMFRHLDSPWAVVLLLPPTALMGGSLPVLARALGQAGCALGSGLSSLYFLNTLGGVTGTLAAGFYLIPIFGVSQSLWIGSATGRRGGAPSMPG